MSNASEHAAPLVGRRRRPRRERCHGSGSFRPSRSSSPSGTSRRAPGPGTRSPTGTGSAVTRTGSDSTTSARSSTTPPSRGALIAHPRARVRVRHRRRTSIGLATRARDSTGRVKTPRAPSRDLLPAGRHELARRLLRLAVHLQLHRSAEHAARRARARVAQARHGPATRRGRCGRSSSSSSGSSSGSRW